MSAELHAALASLWRAILAQESGAQPLTAVWPIEPGAPPRRAVQRPSKARWSAWQKRNKRSIVK